MPSRPLLILGNLIAITITIAAFAQALSWTIAGILILASLVVPLLVNLPPSTQLATQTAPSMPSTTSHSNADANSQTKFTEKHSLSSHQPTKNEPKLASKEQGLRPPLSEHGPVIPQTGAPTIPPPGTNLLPKTSPMRQGPNFNPTIPRDDYAEYDVELEAGKDFLGEVAADGLVNVYLLDEDNMDNLDDGEEFWSEIGEEGVETAKLEFTATSNGRWFFVVENADDREVIVKVNIRTGTIPRRA